jgi:hypothetical protein
MLIDSLLNALGLRVENRAASAKAIRPSYLTGSLFDNELGRMATGISHYGGGSGLASRSRCSVTTPLCHILD